MNLERPDYNGNAEEEFNVKITDTINNIKAKHACVSIPEQAHGTSRTQKKRISPTNKAALQEKGTRLL